MVYSHAGSDLGGLVGALVPEPRPNDWRILKLSDFRRSDSFIIDDM